tara:strand:- start:92 stop:499 length:408 start_codon:yes stop_codon:yes gene_type:complete
MLNHDSQTIVFIDDDCIFCNYWGNYILNNDKSKSIFVSSSSSKIYLEINKKFQKFPNYKETIILYYRGMIYERSSAVIKLALIMDNWQKIAAIGYLIPKFFRDFLYNFISRNRKKIMKDRCVIDKLKIRDKYIID